MTILPQLPLQEEFPHVFRPVTTSRPREVQILEAAFFPGYAGPETAPPARALGDTRTPQLQSRRGGVARFWLIEPTAVWGQLDDR